MGRRRRYIEPLSMYEIGFRAKDSLPLSARPIVKSIIQHALARAQRDEKLYLCHDIWNGSHPHLLVYTKDAEQCKKFYMEVKKKITDCMKRLLSIEQLNLWEATSPMVAYVADTEKAIQRIAYLYANPAQDDLEENIERFPGYSSFEEFLQAKNEKVDTELSEDVMRLRLPKIPALRKRAPSPHEELIALRRMEEDNAEMQPLVRYPNKWMEAFGISDDEVAKINEKVLTRIRKREAAAERLRIMKGKKVMGAKRLIAQAIMKHHKPKKKSIKIFYLGSCNRTRIKFLEAFELFCKKCRQCYQDCLAGKTNINWPPGAFRPPLPPLPA